MKEKCLIWQLTTIAAFLGCEPGRIQPAYGHVAGVMSEDVALNFAPTIPQGNVLVITDIDLSASPLDGNSQPVNSSRADGSFYDSIRIQVTQADGKVLNPTTTDFRYFRGGLVVVDSGKVTVRFSLKLAIEPMGGVTPEQYVIAAVWGFLVPEDFAYKLRAAQPQILT